MRLTICDKGEVKRAPNTHTLYISRHYINIVLILQKNNINQ